MNNSLQDQFFGIIIKKRILEWKKVYKILKGINEKARSSINLSPYRTNITDKQKSKIKELQMDLEETEIESASVFTDYDDVMVALNRIALLLEHNHKKFTTNQRNNINIRLNKLLELYK
jgi:cell division protein FtsI/penicillin-binding protein 2